MARYKITYQVERVGFGDTKEQAIQDSKSYEENPYENPLDQALWFVDQGASWLHIVDLDGAVEGKNVNKVIIQKMLNFLQNKVKIQVIHKSRD